MLARQQGCRRDDGDLFARHGGNESGAQADFGFTETDIAANQTVHRATAGQIVNHRFDGVDLVFGFFIWKARGEFVVKANIGGHDFAVAHGALSRGFYQLIGNEFDFLFKPSFAHLPSNATDFIQRYRHIIAAETAQQFDIFNRQKKPRVAVINQLQAIMRCAADINGLQALKTANAMFNMHHMVARCQAASFGQEVFRFFATRSADHAIAENILLGQDAQTFCRKAVIHRDNGNARALPLLRRLPCVNALHRRRAIFLQKCFQSLHCPAAGGDQKHKTAGSLFFGHMGDHRIKQIDVFLLALGGKAASGSAREVFAIGVFKRANAAPAYIVHALRPFCIKQIKRLRRQRFDDAPPVAFFHIGLHGLMAGLIIIGNLLMALLQRCFGLVIGKIKRRTAMVE